jgi:hypothetical protein
MTINILCALTKKDSCGAGRRRKLIMKPVFDDASRLNRTSTSRRIIIVELSQRLYLEIKAKRAVKSELFGSSDGEKSTQLKALKPANSGRSRPD